MKIQLTVREMDILKRAAGVGGALAVTEGNDLMRLLKRFLDYVELEPPKIQQVPVPLVDTKTTTA